MFSLLSKIDKTEAEANDLVGILSDASSDNTAIDNEVELYGLLEDPCNDDRDCFLDYSQCEFSPELSSKRCQCKIGFTPTSNNLSCEQGMNIRFRHGGKIQLGRPVDPQLI